MPVSSSTSVSDLSDYLDSDNILPALSIQFNHDTEIYSTRVIQQCPVCGTRDVPIYRKPGRGWWIRCPRAGCKGTGDLIRVYAAVYGLTRLPDVIAKLAMERLFEVELTDKLVTDYHTYYTAQDNADAMWIAATDSDKVRLSQYRAEAHMLAYRLVPFLANWKDTVGAYLGHVTSRDYNSALHTRDFGPQCRMTGQPSTHSLISPICDVPGRTIGYCVNRCVGGVRQYHILPATSHGFAACSGLMFFDQIPLSIPAVVLLTDLDLALCLQISHSQFGSTRKLPVVGVTDADALESIKMLPTQRLCFYMPQACSSVLNMAISLEDRGYICTDPLLPDDSPNRVDLMHINSPSPSERVSALVARSRPWFDVLRETLLGFHDTQAAASFAVGLRISTELRGMLLTSGTPAEQASMSKILPMTSRAIEVQYSDTSDLVITRGSMYVRTAGKNAKDAREVKISDMAVEMTSHEIYPSGTVWYNANVHHAGGCVPMRVRDRDFTLDWLMSFAARNGIDARLVPTYRDLTQALVRTIRSKPRLCSDTFGRDKERVVLPCGYVALDGSVEKVVVGVPRYTHPATAMQWESSMESWAPWLARRKLSQLGWRIAALTALEIVTGKRGGIVLPLGTRPEDTFTALEQLARSLCLRTLPAHTDLDISALADELKLGLPVILDPRRTRISLLLEWLRDQYIPRQHLILCADARACHALALHGEWTYLPEFTACNPVAGLPTVPDLLPSLVSLFATLGYVDKVPPLRAVSRGMTAAPAHYFGGAARTSWEPGLVGITRHSPQGAESYADRVGYALGFAHQHGLIAKKEIEEVDGVMRVQPESARRALEGLGLAPWAEVSEHLGPAGAVTLLPVK